MTAEEVIDELKIRTQDGRYDINAYLKAKALARYAIHLHRLTEQARERGVFCGKGCGCPICVGRMKLLETGEMPEGEQP